MTDDLSIRMPAPGPILTFTRDGTIEFGPGLSQDEATQRAAKLLAEQYGFAVADEIKRLRERAERLAVLLAAVTEIAARNEDAECIRESRRALEEADHG